jgi:hypothetical protein
MTGLNHVLVGMAVAVVIRNPILAPIIAFLSHFLLDALPHLDITHYTGKPWNAKFNIWLSIDAVLCFGALALGINQYPQLSLELTICAFAAALPDFLWIFKYGFNVDNWFFRFATKIQWCERPWGYYVEVPFGLIMASLFVFHVL